MPKGVTIQLFHAQSAGNVPPALEQGEFAVDALSDPPRLWTGVPTTRDPSGRIDLLGGGASGGVFGDNWLPAAATVPGLLAGWSGGNTFRISSTANPNLFSLNAATQTLLTSCNVQVGNSLRVTGSATPPAPMSGLTGGTLWYNTAGATGGELRYWDGYAWVNLTESQMPTPSASDQTLQSSGVNPVWRTNLGIGIPPLTNTPLRITNPVAGQGELARFHRYGLDIGGAKVWGDIWEGPSLTIVGNNPAPRVGISVPPYFPNAYTLVYQENPAGIAESWWAVSHNPNYSSWARYGTIGPTAMQGPIWRGVPAGGPGANVAHTARSTTNFHSDMPFTWSLGATWPLPSSEFYYFENSPTMELRSEGLWIPKNSTSHGGAGGSLTIGPTAPAVEWGMFVYLEDNVNTTAHIDVVNTNAGPFANSAICFMNNVWQQGWASLTSSTYANYFGDPFRKFDTPQRFCISTNAANGMGFFSEALKHPVTGQGGGMGFWCWNHSVAPSFWLEYKGPTDIHCGAFAPTDLWVDEWMGAMEGWVATWQCDEIQTPIIRPFGLGNPQYYMHINPSDGTLLWHTDLGIFTTWRRGDQMFYTYGTIGYGNLVNLSDARIKSAIEPERHGLDVVRALNPIDYDESRPEQFADHAIPPPPPRYRNFRGARGNQPGDPFAPPDSIMPASRAARRAPAHRQVGFSAQDVQAVMPDAVYPLGIELADGSGKLDSDTPTLGIAPMALIAVCVNAIKELEQRLVALEQRRN